MSVASGTTPTIGINITARNWAQQVIQRAINQSARLQKAHQKLATSAQKANVAMTRSGKKTTNSLSRQLRKMRWEFVTMSFFFRILARNIKALFELIEQAAESAAARAGTRALGRAYGVDVGTIAQAMREVSNESISVRESLQLVQAGMLRDQGYFAKEYANLWEAARVAAVVSGGDAKAVFEALIESLSAGTAEAADAATPLFRLESALRRYAEASGRTVESLGRQEAAQVMLNTVQERANELLTVSARSALEQADEFKALKAAWADFTDAMGVAAKVAVDLGGVTEAVKGLAWMVSFLGAAGDKAQEQLSKIPESLRGVVHFIPPLGQIESALQDIATGAEAFALAMGWSAEAMGKFQDEVTRTPELPEIFEKAGKGKYDPIVRHLLKREDIFSRHNKRMAGFERDFLKRQEEIRARYWQRVRQITRRIAQQEGRAHRKLLLAVSKAEEQYNLRSEQALEDHLMRMRHKRQLFRMERMHDDAMYNYLRNLLVAEGDTLAIEDLDARHKLEVDRDEDNEKLRRRQDEESFKQQQDQAEEQFKLQLKHLGDALKEQLQEMANRSAEMYLEAREQRDEDLKAAEATWKERQADQKDALGEQLLQWSRYWDDLAVTTELSANQITKIIRHFFGVGGEADLIIEGFAQRALQRMNLVARLKQVLGTGGGAITPYVRPPSLRGTEPPPEPDSEPTWWEKRGWGIGRAGWGQGGPGSDPGAIARPSLVPIGGAVPERYNMPPQSPIGGSMALRWQGGAIPVHGTGQLSAMDLASVGDAITQGIMVVVQESFNA